VKTWNGSRGYGFIASGQIQGDVMFLRSHLPADAKEVRGKFLEGRTVNFDLTTGPDGRSQGANIQITAKDGDFIAGEVISYSERNGYGFIRSSSLTAEVRFNRSDLDALIPGIDLRNELVIAKVHQMPDGKLRADKVMFQSSKIANRLKMGAGMMGGFGKGGFGKGGFGGFGGKGGFGGFGGKGGYDGGFGGYGGYGGKGGYEEEKLVATQGVVVSYNTGKGYGFLKCGKSPVDVYFKASGNYTPGMNLAFNLKINKDGKPSAINLQAGMNSGESYTGTVKAFNQGKGYGFISVPGHLSEVYFIKDMVPPAMQGGNIVGKQVRFTVQISADGKARAEQGAQFY